MEDEKYLLKLKSVSSSNFKILFEVLKDILYGSMNIIFTKNCMKISEIDRLEKAMVHLEIDSDAFQYYQCLQDQIKIGVNAGDIFKMIKVSSSQDAVSFLITKDNPDIFIIRLENSLKNKVFESSIRLLNIDKEILTIPDIKYEYQVSLSSSDFQNTFKNLNSLGDHDLNVEICKSGNQLVFSHAGDFSDQRVIYLIGDQEQTLGEIQESNAYATVNTNDNNIIQGIYNLKYLLLFSKSHKINTEVILYLTNDSPLIIEYRVADLGSLRFLLTQQANEEI